MTVGNAARAGVRLIVWCKKCRHQVVDQSYRFLFGPAKDPYRRILIVAARWAEDRLT
jgi:hypothetical protein